MDRKLNVLHTAVKIYDVEFVQRVECYGLVLDACIILLVGWCKFPFRDLIFKLNHLGALTRSDIQVKQTAEAY